MDLHEKAETDTKNIVIKVHRKSSFSYQFREHQHYLVSSQICPTAVSDKNILFQLLLIFPHQEWLVSNSQRNTEHPPQQQNQGHWLSLVTSRYFSVTMNLFWGEAILIFLSAMLLPQDNWPYLHSLFKLRKLNSFQNSYLILTSCCKTTSSSLKVTCAADTSSNTTLPLKNCLTYHNKQ